jgi:hypothetical protein
MPPDHVFNGPSTTQEPVGRHRPETAAVTGAMAADAWRFVHGEALGWDVVAGDATDAEPLVVYGGTSGPPSVSEPAAAQPLT